jgi:hypothetical protein
MSPAGGGLECEPRFVVAVAVVFKPEGTPLDGAEGGWGAPEDCPEGVEVAAGCAVEPEGVGVSPTVEAMEPRRHSMREVTAGAERSREDLVVFTNEQ